MARLYTVKEINLKRLDREDIEELLENEGYSEPMLRSVSFKEAIDGTFVYDTKYFDTNTGLIEPGRVYVMFTPNGEICAVY
jgi:hypothetical protein